MYHWYLWFCLILPVLVHSLAADNNLPESEFNPTELARMRLPYRSRVLPLGPAVHDWADQWGRERHVDLNDDAGRSGSRRMLNFSWRLAGVKHDNTTLP